MGSLRWALVGLIAHVGATYLSEGWLYLQIVRGAAPESMINVRDVGVSYFVTGLVAVLSYRIARPWRWGYAAGRADDLHRGAALAPRLHCARSPVRGADRPVLLPADAGPRRAMGHLGRVQALL